MTLSSIERKIRARLPAIRFLQEHVPLPVSRWLIRRGMARVRLAAAVTREAVSADGASCEWLTPRSSPKDQALLYLHGGGFVYGLTPPHLEMVAYLAQKMSIRALLVDYRVAPDQPFPAALDDCVTAYRWLLKQGNSARDIVVAGDSAGGNLTITSLMKLRDSDDPLPAAAACLSPVADLSDSGKPSAGFNDPLVPPGAGRLYRESYIAHNDARNPLISPVFGDWHGLPPLLVHAGEDEFLRDDAVRIEELARAAGVDVRLEIYPRMWHVWQIFLTLPQAVQSLDDIAQFLRSHLGPVTQQPSPI
jgi:monoterpene epsilon-lactone hydrolase